MIVIPPAVPTTAPTIVEVDLLELGEFEPVDVGGNEEPIAPAVDWVVVAALLLGSGLVEHQHSRI